MAMLLFFAGIRRHPRNAVRLHLLMRGLRTTAVPIGGRGLLR